MKVAIIGYGHVGKAMHNLFKDALIYDVKQMEGIKLASKQEINDCDAAFICVPTPMNEEDGSCITSMVEEVINWCTCPILIIRSTIPVGFTRSMVAKYHKQIVFQPEYYGETVAHPLADLTKRDWISLGGEQSSIDLAIEVYQRVINSAVKIYQTDSDTAEMAKYMENAFIGTKVTFCNEMYDICKHLNVDYNKVREIWLADPRMGDYFTFVYPTNRGWGGSCLPKDISSIIHQSEQNNYHPTLLKEVVATNKKQKSASSNPSPQPKRKSANDILKELVNGINNDN